MANNFSRRAAMVVAGCVAAATCGFMGAAIAGITAPKTYSGGTLLQTKIANTTSGYTNSVVGDWAALPGSGLKVSVPSGSTRLVVATFSAESHCSVSIGFCAVRIMAKKTGGSTVALHPATGAEYAFDTGNGEEAESNAMVRSRRLGAGTWSISVEMQPTSIGEFFLDDWHFQVDVHK